MILHVDSRQKIYHKEFGDIATDVPAEKIFYVQDIVEPIGEVTCVAISGCKACSSQTEQQYDFQDSFNFSPHNANGMYPPDWFGSIVKRGLKRLNSVVVDSQWKSYWRADLDGAGDRFDNTITAMNHANSACTVWSQFYSNWIGYADGEVMAQGDGPYTEHDWVIRGWKVVNGVTMLVIDAHLGKTTLMPREVFNREVSRMGCGTGIPATMEIESVKSRDFFTWLSDVIKNLWLQVTNIQTQINTMPPLQPKNKIEKWAKLIKQFEGANTALHNPGNFKYSTLMASWGGQKASAGSDGGYFCKFPDDTTGFQALVNFLTLGCEDELKNYHNSRTIKEFTLVYTNHPQPQYDYSDNLIKALGVTPDTDIKTFLS